MLRKVLRFFRRQPIGLIGIFLITVVIVMGSFAGQIAPYEPTAQKFKRLHPPSSEHYFGTDELGRDVFSYFTSSWDHCG